MHLYNTHEECLDLRSFHTQLWKDETLGSGKVDLKRVIKLHMYPSEGAVRYAASLISIQQESSVDKNQGVHDGI